jgi:hypothetical protein
MAEEPDNLILEYLRRFERRLNDMDAKLDRVLDDVHMIKVRMTSVEEALVGIHRRVDRVEERIERIDRRLGLMEPAQ